jgi:hypothetical protein
MISTPEQTGTATDVAPMAAPATARPRAKPSSDDAQATTT